MGFIGNLFKQLFGGDSSSNNSSSGSSSNTRTGSTGVSGNVSNSLKTKYKNIDGQNKLKTGRMIRLPRFVRSLVQSIK